ncbi:MAG: hypothetical protein Q3996_01495 [Candidatus Saccharibacteria bacterium]|nr:hypothetical protein [Candidatus Saccharibacteria bacterium]
MDPIRLAELNNVLRANFDFKTAVSEVVTDAIPVSRSAKLTVFLAEDDRIYAFIQAQSKLMLSDVQKMLSSAGLVVSEFLPPQNRPNYFHEVAMERYQRTYPGRKLVDEQDLYFYKTLASYNPGLAIVKRVKDNKIKTFDADVKGFWRVYCKFYYNKIDVL